MPEAGYPEDRTAVLALSFRSGGNLIAATEDAFPARPLALERHVSMQGRRAGSRSFKSPPVSFSDFGSERFALSDVDRD